MNTKFTTKRQTQERLLEIANCKNLPAASNYCEDDLLNAKEVNFLGTQMIMIFDNEAFVINDDGTVAFVITPFDLKKLFGTKRRLYAKYIAEQIQKFLEGSSGN